MPRYYFHVRDGADLLLDEEGAEFPGRDGALAEAISSARDIVASQVRDGQVVGDALIEITDESGQLVETLQMRSVIRLG